MTRSSARLMPVMVALVAALGLGLPVPASASFFTIDFNQDGILQLDGTDDLPIMVSGSSTINGGLLDGFIKAVDIFSGITQGDIDTSTGTVLFASQDVFFFEVELKDPSAPMDEIGVNVVSLDFFGNPKGAGWLESPPVSNGDEAPKGVVSFPGQAIFDFDVATFPPPANDNLLAGQTSRILFVTYGLGDLQDGQLAEFMVSSGNNANFMVPIVPEPSTVLLLGAGLAAMGAARRRQLIRRGR